MTRISLKTLGELGVRHDGRDAALPASKRTRALLAYLALTARPHRRDRLCEVFWAIPDDPRGALRWSLSKLRPLVNDAAVERLAADRERVTLLTADIDIDIRSIADEIRNAGQPPDRLQNLAQLLQQPLLEGIDLPEQSLFQEWLTAEREEARQLLLLVLRKLSCHETLAPDRSLTWVRTWIELDPFNTEAATLLLTRLEQLGMERELSTVSREMAARFHKADVTWSPDARVARCSDAAPGEDSQTLPRLILARQKVQFCTAADGIRIAHASVGDGPVIVKAANWLSHLELDWNAPIWSPLYRALARDHRIIRYDERGNGLSDWDVDDISFAAFVNDLETVVDANELSRFALLGISQGAAVSIEYAVRHPERVTQLILFGGYAAGWRIDASEATIREREAVMTLTGTGWGQDNPAYRQIFSSTFMPGATAGELSWFNEFQRRTTSPENAVRFLSAFGDIDVRDRLAEVRVPTLVIHSLGDRRIPAATGRNIAASIPNAEFLGLESDGHLLLGREPASPVFVEAVREFIARGT